MGAPGATTRPRCLESARIFWDNQPAVNKPKLLLSSLLVLALSGAGCEKSADLGRMQEETLSLVKMHAKDVEVLQRRADALMVRGRNLGGDAPGIADAGRLLSEARAGLDQLRALLGQAPTTMDTAVKSNEGDQVSRASDELLEKLEAGQVSVRANLAAVDNWLMNVENRPAAPVVPPAPPAPEVPVAPVAPVAPDAGSAAGSAATPAAAGSAAAHN